MPDISQDCCMQLFLMLSKFQTVDARVLNDYCNSNFKSVQCYPCSLDFTFCNSLTNTWSMNELVLVLKAMQVSPLVGSKTWCLVLEHPLAPPVWMPSSVLRQAFHVESPTLNPPPPVHTHPQVQHACSISFFSLFAFVVCLF